MVVGGKMEMGRSRFGCLKGMTAYSINDRMQRRKCEKNRKVTSKGGFG
jgi:hypothetical protein